MKKILSQRALVKFKFMSGTFFLLVTIVLLVGEVFGIDGSYIYKDKEYDKMDSRHKNKGYILEFTNDEDFCHR